MIDPKLVKAMNEVVKAALAWHNWIPDENGGDSLDEVERALSEAVFAYLEKVKE